MDNQNSKLTIRFSSASSARTLSLYGKELGIPGSLSFSTLQVHQLSPFLWGDEGLAGRTRFPGDVFISSSFILLSGFRSLFMDFRLLKSRRPLGRLCLYVVSCVMSVRVRIRPAHSS